MRATVGIFVVSCCVLTGAAGLSAGAAKPQNPPPPQGGAPGAPGAPGAGGGPGRGAPAPLQNIKVLPKEWNRQQVQRLMGAFVVSLGLAGTPTGGQNGCEHCHAPDPNAPPAQPGGRGPGLAYQLDLKPTKDTARKMIQMVMQINENLKGVGDAAVPEKVTCFTCHQGQIKPAIEPAGGWGRGGFSLLPAGPPAPPAPAGGAPGGGPGGGGPGGGGPGGPGAGGGRQ